MRKLNYFLCLFIGFFAFSQSTLSISGKVVNPAGDPLPFATVGVIGSPHGTISNSNGEFTFFLPDSYSNDTLSIRHLGFETYKSVIKHIESPLSVSLKESITVLEEVVVNAEQLTAKQIIQKALYKLGDNYNSSSFITRGFFRDIRDQNGETVYLVEAAVDIQDRGFLQATDRSKKFFLRGVRATQTRINPLLKGSLLNSGNSLIVNLEHNYWLNRLKQIAQQNEFMIDKVVSQDGKLFYIISTEQTSAKPDLAEKYKDMIYTLIHRYQVDAETYAIHKVEHLEYPRQGKYVGIERPYQGDTLFYSKKGWNQVIEFEEYQGKMYLRYHDVNYAFDIFDEKNDEVYLNMAYQFVFTTTEILADKSQKPNGSKMNRSKPLVLQAHGYDSDFWKDPSNAKLVPLTQKQINDLEKYQSLEEQFQSKKKKPNKSTN